MNGPVDPTRVPLLFPCLDCVAEALERARDPVAIGATAAGGNEFNGAELIGAQLLNGAFLVPWEKSGGQRWRGPRSWYDAMTPSLLAVRRGLTISSVRETGVWFATALCPRHAERVAGRPLGPLAGGS